jgi:hypothetical protein
VAEATSLGSVAEEVAGAASGSDAIGVALEMAKMLEDGSSKGDKIMVEATPSSSIAEEATGAAASKAVDGTIGAALAMENCSSGDTVQGDGAAIGAAKKSGSTSLMGLVVNAPFGWWCRCAQRRFRRCARARSEGAPEDGSEARVIPFRLKGISKPVPHFQSAAGFPDRRKTMQSLREKAGDCNAVRAAEQRRPIWKRSSPLFLARTQNTGVSKKG